MKFETKFNMGERVFSISHNNQRIWKICSFCDSEGNIVGADSDISVCPKCYGNKGKYEYFNTGWHIDGQLTTGQVQITYRGKSKGIAHGPIKFDNFGPQSELYEERYMCAETGIGSGTLHGAATLFSTQEEAQAECDRLNKEMQAVITDTK